MSLLAELSRPDALSEFQILINLILLFFLVVVALAIVYVRDILASVLLMGIFSLLMAAMYLVLSAPDVAITEAAVGGGLGTIIFLCAVMHTGQENKGPSCNLFTPILVVCVVGGALLFSTPEMPKFGEKSAPVHTHVAPYYLSETPEDIGIPNVVTAVLASYRGFDTLGEVTVVFTAAMAVLLLLGVAREDKYEGEDRS